MARKSEKYQDHRNQVQRFNMKVLNLLAITLSTAFLVACGGAGGGGTATVVSTSTFQLKTAYVNDLTQIRSGKPFTISGTINGVTVTGNGTVTSGSATAASFEGAPVLQQTSTASVSLIANGRSTPLTTTSTSYVDSNYMPKGVSSSTVGAGITITTYEIVTGAVNIPATARVYDTGSLITFDRYTTSAKTSYLGTTEYSFALQPDTAATALLKIISTDKDTLGAVTQTSTSTFRIDPNGAFTELSETAVDSTGTLTFTY